KQIPVEVPAAQVTAPSELAKEKLLRVDAFVQRFEKNAGRPTLPNQIDRYRVEKILGQGGFGVVYLAHDDQLSRPVAIKVPHPKFVARPEDAEAYLTEARIVAALDHPNIVPVYDVGNTQDHPLDRKSTRL